MLNLVSKKITSKSQVAKLLASKQARSFSHGPYNPLVYKTALVPEEMPT